MEILQQGKERGKSKITEKYYDDNTGKLGVICEQLIQHSTERRREGSKKKNRKGIEKNRSNREVCNLLII